VLLLKFFYQKLVVLLDEEQFLPFLGNDRPGFCPGGSGALERLQQGACRARLLEVVVRAHFPGEPFVAGGIKSGGVENEREQIEAWIPPHLGAKAVAIHP